MANVRLPAHCVLYKLLFPSKSSFSGLKLRVWGPVLVVFLPELQLCVQLTVYRKEDYLQAALLYLLELDLNADPTIKIFLS